jgi:thioredoxin reductase
MSHKTKFDVIIIGGSYSGLAAALALGRALRNVLVIDDGKPCNRWTPGSHNFLTHDGKAPAEIATLARDQLRNYENISFLDSLAVSAAVTKSGFEVTVATGSVLVARKLIFATGIRDIMPDIPGFAECWGKSVLHCPYCHGYEVRYETTGILGNGDYGYEFSSLINNWTNNLTLYTNGASTLTQYQTDKLHQHGINIVEKQIADLDHVNGYLRQINFQDGSSSALKALYTKVPFQQHCLIPESLGCVLDDDGYIKVDSAHNATVPGVFACGDNTTRMRTVANAVSTGTTAGIMVNKALIADDF